MKRNDFVGGLSKPILDAKSAFGISPLDGAVDAGDRTGAAFETTCEFNGHLLLLGEGVEVCRAGIDAESFLAGMTELLIEKDMGLFIVLKGIKRQLFGDFHSTPLIETAKRKTLGAKDKTNYA